tara:strand:- start:4464 stop:4607 length:144 start_codon:yes stop_codon:yes gene_type:complete
MKQLDKLRIALRKQRDRTATDEDLFFIATIHTKYGTINPLRIQNLTK